MKSYLFKVGLFYFCTRMDSLNTVLFDDQTWQNLLPLTYTRPVSELRVGITTITQKWQHIFDAFPEEISFLTEDYLSHKYKLRLEGSNLFVNGSVLPNTALLHAIQALPMEKCLMSGKHLLAFKTLEADPTNVRAIIENPNSMDIVAFSDNVHKINQLWDIFQLNGYAITQDFNSITASQETEELSVLNTLIGSDHQLFIASEESIDGVTLNTKDGPIYIGSGVKILEGSMLRGPLAICENAVIKMGAKIYGNTTIGPFSKVGGELSNVVIQGYSNKGHDGYLGNAILGEWCNLGADTNCSNLKNNYSNVKVWNYVEEDFANSGQQFCGLIMGDHSKSGINSMFNTGTVVGVSSNIFGTGFPPKFIPSFSWGTGPTAQVYDFEKALDTAERVMSRRHVHLSNIDRDILQEIFKRSEKFRATSS